MSERRIPRFIVRHFAMRVLSAAAGCLLLAASLTEYRDYEWIGAVVFGAAGIAATCYALFGPPVTTYRPRDAPRTTSPRER